MKQCWMRIGVSFLPRGRNHAFLPERGPVGVEEVERGSEAQRDTLCAVRCGAVQSGCGGVMAGA